MDNTTNQQSLLENRPHRANSTDKTPLLASDNTNSNASQLPGSNASSLSMQAILPKSPHTLHDVDHITDEQVDELDKNSGSRNSASGRMQRIREHFIIDTNVQIGLEMLPPVGGKLMFYSWYVVLIASLILGSDLNWQYTCNDVCGTRECLLGKVNAIPEVTSDICASVVTVSLLGTTPAPLMMMMMIRSNDNEKNNGLSKQDQLFLAASSPSSSNDNINPESHVQKSLQIEVYNVEGVDDANEMIVRESNNNNLASSFGFSEPQQQQPSISKKYCSNYNDTDLPAYSNSSACAISWFGGFGNILDSKLNRYAHLRFSMPRPHWVNETDDEKAKSLSFQLTFTLALKNATAVSDQGVSGNRVKAVAPVSCRSNQVQCDAVTIPVVFGSVTNESTFTLLAYDVPSLAYISAIHEGAVQAIFQKAGYTIATLVFRYVFFVATFFNLAQLLYSRYTVWNHLKGEKEKKRKRKLKQKLAKEKASALLVASNSDENNNNVEGKKVGDTSATGADNSDGDVDDDDRREHLGEFEQNWALLLNVMLLLYMNPFFAVSVYVQPTPAVFMFLEYKVPLYFIYTVVLCVLALCLATLETKPSYGMRIFLVLLFVLILTLDLIDSSNKNWNFNTVECVNFQCSSIRWAILTIIIATIFVIAFLLFYLHRNLAQLPYLATRPRQLSMRLMIFIFTAYVVYYIISTVANLILFENNDVLDQSHAELKLGTIMSAFAFVAIITTAFKFVLRTDRIPPHPSDLRWKKIYWTSQWHTWLNLHGGGAYIFFNEDEEEEFDIVQETKQDNVSSNASDTDDSEADRKKSGDADDEDENDQIIRPSSGIFSSNTNNNNNNHTNGVNASSSTSSGYGAASTDYKQFVGSADEIASPHHQQQQQQPSPRASPEEDAYAAMAYSGDNGSVRKGHSRTGSSGSFSSRVFKRIDSLASIDDQNMSKFWRRPQQFIDKVEDLTLATAKILRLVSADRQPFMNLETAIDSFNLAYEAYGVPVSRGDERIHTGITFTEAIHQTKKVTQKFVCCCFHSEQTESDSDVSRTPGRNDSGLEGHDNHNNNNYSPQATGTFGQSYNSSKNKYTKNKKGNQDSLLLLDDENNNNRRNDLTNASFTTQDSIDHDPYGAAKLFSAAQKRNNNNINNNVLQQQQQQSSATTVVPILSPRVSITPSKNNVPATSYGPDVPTINGKVPINTEQYGYKQLFVYENFDMQVVISEMDTVGCERHKDKHPRYVIAFRGTDNQTNLRQDFRFTREVWREMQKELSFVNSLLEAKVHKGFLEHWTALQSAVLEKMAQLVIAKPESRIYVVGHSAGGAVACLCGYAMVVRFRGMMIPHRSAAAIGASSLADELDTDRLVQVYTFGMPKLGDSVFREEYNKKVPYTFRIVNESDTVSGIGVFMGHHVGMEVCIDRFGNFICNPMPVEKLFRPTQGKGVGLRHHSMYGYSASINKIAAHTSLGSCPARCLEPYIEELATSNMVLTNQNLSSHSQERRSSTSVPREESAISNNNNNINNNKQNLSSKSNDDDNNSETGSNDSGGSVREL